MCWWCSKYVGDMSSLNGFSGRSGDGKIGGSIKNRYF